MMKLFMTAMLVAGLATATPVLAQTSKSKEVTYLSPEQAADRLVWIDEHARWNFEHMAAARRLEAIVAALKQHNTGFDIHGRELREHGTTAAGPPAADAHPRLRTAHEQARNVHDDLMDAVDVLARVLRKNLGKNQSFPNAVDRAPDAP